MSLKAGYSSGPDNVHDDEHTNLNTTKWQVQGLGGPCSLLLETSATEWVFLKSSLQLSLVLYQDGTTVTKVETFSHHSHKQRQEVTVFTLLGGFQVSALHNYFLTIFYFYSLHV